MALMDPEGDSAVCNLLAAKNLWVKGSKLGSHGNGLGWLLLLAWSYLTWYKDLSSLGQAQIVA